MKEAIIIVISFIIMVMFVMIVSNIWQKGQIEKACYVFSKESGRETKFVEYTFWTRDCLTPVEGGKWISAFNLRGN